MSHPSEWSTTYSNVFRDRRQYQAPNAAPSDESWSSRTQAYYGPPAALSEHAARTAEVQARTNYGAHPPLNAEVSTGFASTKGYGNTPYAGFDPNASSRTAYPGSPARTGPVSPTGTASGVEAVYSPVRVQHPHKDLWNAPLLPLSPGSIAQSSVAINPPSGGQHSTMQFPNGYNNGYAGELQFHEQRNMQDTQQRRSGAQQQHSPKQHIPGYSGFLRGSQFVHGETFGKTSRGLLSVPSNQPLAP